MLSRSRAIMAIAAVTSMFSASSSFAGVVTFTTPAVAVQNGQDLFGFVNTPLVAVGAVTWNLDVDASGNSINSDSSMSADFHGILPNAFAPLGLAGLPFELSTLPGSQTVTVTDNGTTVTVDTTLSLSVPAAGMTLYTSVPSEFVTSVSGVPFTSFFATSPDQTAVYIGDNPFGLSPGTAVGDSSDRVIYSTPEPGTLAVLGFGLASLGTIGWMRKRQEPYASASASSKLTSAD